MSEWEVVEDDAPQQWEAQDPRQQAMQVARQQIDQKYPGMPDWLKSGLLNIADPQGAHTPKAIAAGAAGLGRSLGELGLLGQRRIEDLGGSMQDLMHQFPNQQAPQPQQAPISERGQQLLNEYLPEQLPKQLAPEHKTIMDTLLQKGIEYSPEILGGGALLRAGLRRFPVTQRGASRQLRQAEQMAGDQLLPMQTEHMEAAREFLPQTQATEEMLQRAWAGEYPQVFGAQSQVGHHARALEKSPFAAERLQAGRARELKANILGDMEKQLRANGMNEAADALKGGINDYRKYMKVKEKLTPLLKKIGYPTAGLAVLGLGLTAATKALKDKN